MTPKTISRRDFLKVASLTLAGATLTCSGLGNAVMCVPEIEIPELAYE